LTAEPGVVGGIPAAGLNFGAAVNTQAIIDQPYQFDFYDGGGLDMGFLGLAQADREGNLNVSKFGPRLAGAGGFINISQSAKNVIFVGTFTAGDLRVAVEGGRLVLHNDIGPRKFVREVEHRTFSGSYAIARGQNVLYVTERCVFRLMPDGMELTEVAPGVDIERDILARMDFVPVIRGQPQLMDAAIFGDEPMGLRERMLVVPLSARFAYDDQQNVIFINFERLKVRTRQDVDAIEREVDAHLKPIGHRVYAIVNYDHFELVPEVEEDYAAMVKRLVDRYYDGVSRYTTSGFLRAKLGSALKRRGLAPHVYESPHEALAHVRDP
jgi:propionate CoA-transferase